MPWNSSKKPFFSRVPFQSDQKLILPKSLLVEGQIRDRSIRHTSAIHLRNHPRIWSDFAKDFKFGAYIKVQFYDSNSIGSEQNASFEMISNDFTLLGRWSVICILLIDWCFLRLLFSQSVQKLYRSSGNSGSYENWVRNLVQNWVPAPKEFRPNSTADFANHHSTGTRLTMFIALSLCLSGRSLWQLI